MNARLVVPRPLVVGPGDEPGHPLRLPVHVDGDEHDVRRVRVPALAGSANTSTVMSIDELPTKSTVAWQVTSSPRWIGSRKSTRSMLAVTAGPPACRIAATAAD